MTSGPGAVCVQPDYRKVAAALEADLAAPRWTGCAQAALSVAPINGRTVIDVAITTRTTPSRPIPPWC